ncbi:hypothetical protein FOL47_005622 [Perkinsus chesapeaki]|uniref:Uncharacterized protein n=1 Tax=Perkinsus chesapeaki TaxID=330153 RepID=A0A7J6N0P0_PERCH|nr:hypothetical protein FOL47_005622 [Perkinsus chesapeaki]
MRSSLLTVITWLLLAAANKSERKGPIIEVDDGPPEYKVYTDSQEPEDPPSQMDVEPMWYGDKPILHGRSWPDEAVRQRPRPKLTTREGEFTSGVDDESIKEVWDKYPVAINSGPTYSDSNPVQAATLGMIASLGDPLNEVALMPDLPDHPADDSEIVRHESLESKPLEEALQFALEPRPKDISDRMPPLPRMRGFAAFSAATGAEESSTPSETLPPDERNEKIRQHRLAGNQEFNEDFDVDTASAATLCSSVISLLAVGPPCP